ncbi:hypothetical protein [Labrys monachus]|uniref:Uncharacterized protein n=1 Tax=Labrys monachus TaxID=217067 RepID=A0ABU0FMQ5_9HYPH|nr:hypothetical protein [Labrys monachus]MDQ0395887.1 hypothetical protein [Labrys monachus]
MVSGEKVENLRSFDDILIGQRVSSLVFVEDYSQIVFDDCILTLFRWPEICRSSLKIKFGDIEYRNLYCEIINKKVVTIEETIEGTKIDFENAISINLNENISDDSIIESGFLIEKKTNTMMSF